MQSICQPAGFWQGPSSNCLPQPWSFQGAVVAKGSIEEGRLVQWVRRWGAHGRNQVHGEHSGEIKFELGSLHLQLGSIEPQGGRSPASVSHASAIKTKLDQEDDKADTVHPGPCLARVWRGSTRYERGRKTTYARTKACLPQKRCHTGTKR